MSRGSHGSRGSHASRGSHTSRESHAMKSEEDALKLRNEYEQAALSAGHFLRDWLERPQPPC